MTPDELARVGLRVKPLEWQDFEGRGAKAQAWLQANYMIQKWSDGRYEISASHPGYSTFIEGMDRFYPTLEAAKAAAQANYEARILAALRAMPADPVAEAARAATEEMNTPQRAAFWAWLPLAYRDGHIGSEPKFTKYNMAVAHLAGWEAALAQEKPHD